MAVIAELFDHLNDVYRSYLEVEMQSQVSLNFIEPIFFLNVNMSMFRKNICEWE
jgi:hypothetical protein